MSVTVVLTGMPISVSLTDIAYNLDKLFDTDEIGTFKVRNLRNYKYKTHRWQIALDFKSGFDAIVAQHILDGYIYTVPNGTEYKIRAKVTNDPELLNKEPLSPETSSSSRSIDSVSCSSQTLVSQMGDEELYRANTKLDDDTDSEDERRRRRRSRFHRSSSGDTRPRSRDSVRYTHRSSHVSCKSRDMKSNSSRSHSRERKHPRPVVVFHKISPSKRTHYELSQTRKCSDREKYKQYLSAKKRYETKRYSSAYYDIRDRHYPDSSRGTRTGYDRRELTMRHDDYCKGKYYKDRCCDEEMITSKRCDATELIMAEMQSALDLMINKKNIKLLWNEANVILKQAKAIIVNRMSRIRIRDDMSVNSVITYYRYQHSQVDDGRLLLKLVSHLAAAPQDCLWHDDETTPVATEKLTSTERTLPFDEQDGDSKIWRQMDEVLHDIKMESETDRDEPETKVNVAKQPENAPNGGITEIVDVTNEPLIDKENNKQFEIIIVIKKTNDENPNNILKQTKCEPSSTEVNDLNESHSEFSVKTIPLNPMFCLTVRKVLKQMKCHIDEVTKHVDVKKLDFILKERLRSKIRKLLEGKCYMSHSEITKLFRAHNPVDDDKLFVTTTVKDIQNGKFDDFIANHMERIEEESSNRTRVNELNVNVYPEKCESMVKDEKPTEKTDLNNQNQNVGFENVVKSEHTTPKGTEVIEDDHKEAKEKINATPNMCDTKKPKIEKQSDVAHNKVNKLPADEVVLVDTGADIKVIILSDSEDEQTDTRQNKEVIPMKTNNNVANGRHKKYLNRHSQMDLACADVTEEHKNKNDTEETNVIVIDDDEMTNNLSNDVIFVKDDIEGMPIRKESKLNCI